MPISRKVPRKINYSFDGVSEGVYNLRVYSSNTSSPINRVGASEETPIPNSRESVSALNEVSNYPSAKRVIDCVSQVNCRSEWGLLDV